MKAFFGHLFKVIISLDMAIDIKDLPHLFGLAYIMLCYFSLSIGNITRKEIGSFKFEQSKFKPLSKCVLIEKMIKKNKDKDVI